MGEVVVSLEMKENNCSVVGEAKWRWVGLLSAMAKLGREGNGVIADLLLLLGFERRGLEELLGFELEDIRKGIWSEVRSEE